jgi:hypothetical protein
LDLPQHARFLGVFLDAIAEVGAVPPARSSASPTSRSSSGCWSVV